MNWSDSLAMGGYGAYVWTAYGITLLAFGISIALSLHERNKVRKIIRQYLLEIRPTHES
jgi:heme exporter protein CcmD